MKKVKRRAGAALLLAGLLVVGLVVYLIRLADDGQDWVMFRANNSVYSGGVLDTERAASIVLDEFRAGKLGRITLQKAPAKPQNTEAQP